MSGATDSGMMKTMGLVMAALTIFAIVCVTAARMLSFGGEDHDDPMLRNALMQRIEPVASVRTSADDLPVVVPQAVMAIASAPKSGEELVNGACAACHAAGVAGAPKVGDEAAWAARRELGLDALVSSVISGKGSMPARGASTYSDDEIRLSVQFIAGFEADEPSASEAATPTEEKAVEAESVAPVGEAVAAFVVGEVPDGLTDNVKATVDSLCVSCHISGVANAPKIGDKPAWQTRADQGLVALTNSVINGLNAMPPRGGSALADEEIPVAIQYLMSK